MLCKWPRIYCPYYFQLLLDGLAVQRETNSLTTSGDTQESGSVRGNKHLKPGPLFSKHLRCPHCSSWFSSTASCRYGRRRILENERAGIYVDWNGDGMHRGFTKPGVERLTLSCAYVEGYEVESIMVSLRKQQYAEGANVPRCIAF